MDKKSMQLPEVDLVFNCYEKTYELVLNEDFISEICTKNAFPFKNRIIIINNVKNREKVEHLAANLVQKKVIDLFFFVEDYIERVFTQLKMSIKDWGRIYYFSNWALVMLYVVKSKYLVHWDCHITLETKSNWITPSLIELERNKKCIIACPMWSSNSKKVKDESYLETDTFFYNHGFSDLVFLVNRFNLLKPFYNYHHPFSGRFPLYFVNPTFESRIDSHLRRYDFSRIVYKKAIYTGTETAPDMGANYPHYSLLEIIRKFSVYSRLKLLNFIYDPVTNRYRIRMELILKLIREDLLNIKNIKNKIKRIINRIKRVLSSRSIGSAI